jgi:cell division protein FtsI (penicillin-binding protein 3)
MKNKILATFIVLLALYAAVIVKAFKVQVFDREKLIAYSQSQALRVVKTYPRRGSILDRNGNPLAINVKKYNIFYIPKESNKLKSEVRKLVKTVPGFSFNELYKKLKSRKKYTWIKRQVELTDDQVKKLKGLNQIFIESQSSRIYPNHDLLAQTLGFVGIDNDGLGGIEYQFNKSLKGQAQVKKYYKDAKGRPVKFKSADIEGGSEDIKLSIDKEIQAVLENALKEGVERHKALRGGAAVMDAQTGEIWAIANYPTYDPNLYKKYKSTDRKLSFVTDPFEPGSTFKTLTVAAALENNIVRPDTNYYCEKGKFRVGNHFIRESDSNHVYEWLSVEDILKYSSNIGTTKIAFDVGFDVLEQFINKFKIGKKTGIEIPGESRGILDSEDRSPLKLSNVSFGQGIATTAVQMLAAYGVFANGGVYVRPTLIKDGNKGTKFKRIISKKTANEITEMMIKAVEEGTGSKAKVPHFVIAGKTSTAQKTDETGRYNGYISGFLGFPVNVNKRFVVYTYVVEPKENGYYGNLVAAPIFQKIVKNILYKRKEYNQLAIADAKKSTKRFDTISTRQSAKVIMGKGKVPNVIGLDKTTAFKVLDKMGLEYRYRGFGIVKEQHPEAGTPIAPNQSMTLKFQAPAYD